MIAFAMAAALVGCGPTAAELRPSNDSRQPWIAFGGMPPVECVVNVHWTNSRETPVIEKILRFQRMGLTGRAIPIADPISQDLVVLLSRNISGDCDMSEIATLLPGATVLETSDARGITSAELAAELEGNSDRFCDVVIDAGSKIDQYYESVRLLASKMVGGFYKFHAEGNTITVRMYRNCEIPDRDRTQAVLKLLQSDIWSR